MITAGYVPDADAVHIAQGALVARFLSAAGLTVIEHRGRRRRYDV